MALVGELIYSTAAQWFLEQIFEEVKDYVAKKLKNLGEEQESATLRSLGDFLESDRDHFDDKLKEYELNKLKNARLHLKMALTPLEEEMLEKGENNVLSLEDKHYDNPEKLTQALNVLDTAPGGWSCSDRRDAFKKEIDNAYYWSMDAFTTINNDLGAKMQALKILLFCNACIHRKDWPKQWNILLGDEFLKRRDVQKTWNKVRKPRTDHSQCIPLPKLPKFLPSSSDKEKRLQEQEQLFRFFMNVNRILERVKATPPEIIEITQHPTATPELFEALQQGSAKEVRSLLSNNRNVNGVDDIGRTPLVYAIEVKAPIQCVQDVIACGADVHNEVLGNPPLYWAVIHENEDAADELLNHTKADALDHMGRTVLHFAAGLRRAKMIKWLVKTKHADVNMENRWKQTPLETATECMNEDEVRVILECGGNSDNYYNMVCRAIYGGNSKIPSTIRVKPVSVTDYDGFNPLHAACHVRDIALIKRLITEGVDVTGKDYTGKTPLHVAIKCGNKQTLEILVERYKGRRGGAPEGTFDAAHEEIEETNRNYDVIRELGSEKDDTLNTDSGETLVHYAARYDNIDAVTYLHRNGFAISRINSRGRTPLDVAAIAGNKGVFGCLIQLGAKAGTDAEGLNTLHLAADSILNDEAIITQLVCDYGFDVNSITNNGKTPLHLAARRNNDRVITRLLDRGAAAAAVDIDGNGALHYAAFSNDLGPDDFVYFRSCDIESLEGNSSFRLTLALDDEEALLKEDIFRVTASRKPYADRIGATIKVLVDWGHDPNMRNKSSCTPLHYAARQGNNNVISALVENGADLHAVDDHDRSALHYAALCDKVSFFRPALRWSGLPGPRLILYCKDSSRLRVVDHGNTEAIKVLVESGAELEAADNDGNNAMHYATLKIGHMDSQIIAMLSKYGLDVNAQNKMKRTPLHLASLLGNAALIKQLIGLGSSIEAVDHKGSSALHYAVSFTAWVNEIEEEIQLLIEKAKREDCFRNTPFISLFRAAESIKETAKTLLRSCEGLLFANEQGSIALHFGMFGENDLRDYALRLLVLRQIMAHRVVDHKEMECFTAKADAVKVLKDSGANTQLVNEDGKKPIDYAIDGEVINILSENQI